MRSAGSGPFTGRAPAHRLLHGRGDTRLDLGHGAVLPGYLGDLREHVVLRLRGLVRA